MKKISFIIKFWFLLLICLCFSNCKKNSEQPIDKLNIVLYDKPLSVIQECIQGKWKLEYEKGGICWPCINYINNFYWDFSIDNKIRQTYNGTLITDATINWKWSKPVNTDYTYIMNFEDKRGIPYLCVVYEIHNDTLVLTDAGYDPVAYFLVKSN